MKRLKSQVNSERNQLIVSKYDVGLSTYPLARWANSRLGSHRNVSPSRTPRGAVIPFLIHDKFIYNS